MLRNRRYESQEAMLKNRRYDLRRQWLKEITHLRHFFENIANNFHNTVFSFSFQKHLLFPKLNHGFRKITEK